MAMTLRLTDEQHAALTALAAAQGISKNEAAVRAIHDSASRISRHDRIATSTDRAVARYGDLLDRLGQ